MKAHILIFGSLNKIQEYSRAFILCKVFEDLGCQLSFCTVNFGFARSDRGPIIKIIILFLNAPLRWLRLTFKYFFSPAHDLIYVPYPSHADAWLACILAKIKHRPIILDAFFGLYDTIIRDRHLLRPKSFLANLIWHYEKMLLQSADCVLMDTKEHVQMLIHDFNHTNFRARAVPIGIDESLWIPVAFPSGKTFNVIFWSTFIPLHGCEVVAHAAKLLEFRCPEVQFLVIGKGQEAKKFKQVIEQLKPKNLTWINEFIPLQKIQNFVQQSHCCLGIFGTNEKTQRVIPYKAYQALASARPLITARTRASEFLFDNGKNAILINPGDSMGLAASIQQLAADRGLAISIGKMGRRLYEERLSNAVIRDRIKQILESVFK